MSYTQVPEPGPSTLEAIRFVLDRKSAIERLFNQHRQERRFWTLHFLGVWMS